MTIQDVAPYIQTCLNKMSTRFCYIFLRRSMKPRSSATNVLSTASIWYIFHIPSCRFVECPIRPIMYSIFVLRSELQICLWMSVKRQRYDDFTNCINILRDLNICFIVPFKRRFNANKCFWLCDKVWQNCDGMTPGLWPRVACGGLKYKKTAAVAGWGGLAAF